jgi:predicted GNAT family N-acyltransferase
VAGDSGAPAADRGRIGVDHLTTIQILEVRAPAELEQALAIRRAVFVQEQGVDAALEFDQRDDEARHLLALRGGEAVGTLRVRFLDAGRTAKIERVAVVPGARRCRIGQTLVEAALAMARLGGADTASLHAQTTVQAFYGKLCFVAFGPEFMEDGIAHIAMRRSLPADDAGDRRGRP